MGHGQGEPGESCLAVISPGKALDSPVDKGVWDDAHDMT